MTNLMSLFRKKTAHPTMSLLVLFASALFSVQPVWSAEKSTLTYESLFGRDFHHLTPQWGFAFLSSPNAFNGMAISSRQNNLADHNAHPAYSVGLQVDYQPAFLQSYGVFGIGPSFQIYPFFRGNIVDSPTAVFSFGGHVRYQARYFHKQVIVPVVSYSAERLDYRFEGEKGEKGKALIHGPSFGIWLFLTALDRASGIDMFADSGVLRTYAVLEYRMLYNANAEPKIRNHAADGTFYFGIRFEL